jgi:serine/threonine protein phosphatase 1
MTPGTDEIFGALRLARRVWAVASIHGDAARLGALHRALLHRFIAGDRLVYLGNYLGHGSNILGTLDELLLFRRELLCLPGLEASDIVFLRGAQEEMWRKLLQLQFAVTPGSVFDWMLGQGVAATLQAYGGDPEQGRARCREGVLSITRWTASLREAMRRHPGHEELLQTALRRAAYTEGGELLLVHAGIDPHRPLTEQGDTFWWGSGYFPAIPAQYEGFRQVVSGYDRSHARPQLGAAASCIDAGCGFGGPLVAACFDISGQVADWIEA